MFRKQYFLGVFTPWYTNITSLQLQQEIRKIHWEALKYSSVFQELDIDLPESIILLMGHTILDTRIRHKGFW